MDEHLTAMILVGGLGTRLRPVVSDRPKPMALVHGVPFLEILVDTLSRKGVTKIVLLTGYQGEVIETHFKSWHSAGSVILLSHEDKPLGTGGAIKHAERFAGDPTLVVNGDTFLDVDIARLLDTHQRNQADVTLSLIEVPDVGRYGEVEVNENSRVTGFHEKQSGSSKPGLVNAGVSLLARDFIRRLPAQRPFSMETEVFPEVARSGRMFGVLQRGPFFDIGTPESYDAFKHFIQQRGV